MRILYATFSTPDEFLGRLALDGDAASLRIATKARFEPGEELILEIGFPGLPNRILLRAEAIAPGPDMPRAGKEPGKDKDGEEVAFKLASGEEDKRDFLVAVAAGRATASWKRRHRRFPMRLPARFVVERDDAPLRGDAEIEDLGSGGVSLKTSRTLPDGAKVTVVLDPLDGSPEIEFSGRVVWNRQDDSVSGVGIQFDTLGGDDMKRLRRIIRDVKLSGKTIE
jgi:Tfp pilus assembly protein PilZ